MQEILRIYGNRGLIVAKWNELNRNSLAYFKQINIYISVTGRGGP
jgi:hypothetical protein